MPKKKLATYSFEELAEVGQTLTSAAAWVDTDDDDDIENQKTKAYLASWALSEEEEEAHAKASPKVGLVTIFEELHGIYTVLNGAYAAFKDTEFKAAFAGSMDAAKKAAAGLEKKPGTSEKTVYDLLEPSKKAYKAYEDAKKVEPVGFLGRLYRFTLAPLLDAIADLWDGRHSVSNVFKLAAAGVVILTIGIPLAAYIMPFIATGVAAVSAFVGVPVVLAGPSLTAALWATALVAGRVVFDSIGALFKRFYSKERYDLTRQEVSAGAKMGLNEKEVKALNALLVNKKNNCKSALQKKAIEELLDKIHNVSTPEGAKLTKKQLILFCKAEATLLREAALEKNISPQQKEQLYFNIRTVISLLKHLGVKPLSAGETAPGKKENLDALLSKPKVSLELEPEAAIKISIQSPTHKPGYLDPPFPALYIDLESKIKALDALETALELDLEAKLNDLQAKLNTLKI